MMMNRIISCQKETFLWQTPSQCSCHSWFHTMFIVAICAMELWSYTAIELWSYQYKGGPNNDLLPGSQYGCGLVRSSQMHSRGFFNLTWQSTRPLPLQTGRSLYPASATSLEQGLSFLHSAMKDKWIFSREPVCSICKWSIGTFSCSFMIQSISIYFNGLSPLFSFTLCTMIPLLAHWSRCTVKTITSRKSCHENNHFLRHFM